MCPVGEHDSDALSPAPERLPPAAVRLAEALEQCDAVRRFTYLAEVGSTSDWARSHIRQQPTPAAADGTLIVAGHQTAGRGRHGRRWHAPPGEALLFSFITALPAGALTVAAPVAVAEAIRAITGVAAGIKWPNDILVNDAKTAGILIEMEGPLAIVGVGINTNLRTAALPADIGQPVASLAEAAGTPVDEAALLATLLQRMDALARPASAKLREQRLAAFCTTLGRRIEVDTPAGRLTGTALAISDSGALVLRLDDGPQREILAADIRHLDQPATGRG